MRRIHLPLVGDLFTSKYGLRPAKKQDACKLVIKNPLSSLDEFAKKSEISAERPGDHVHNVQVAASVS